MDNLHEDLQVILHYLWHGSLYTYIYRSDKFFEHKMQKQMKNILHGIRPFGNY